MYQRLIAYGNASLIDKPVPKFYEQADGHTECRSIPMTFTFRNNHKQIREDVVFMFNSEGKIASLAFAIDNPTRQEIFDKPAKWSPQVRMAIANFLENYKTAYALKRMDFIRSIFDDDAIIIVGTVAMKADKANDSQLHLKKNVKYNTYNKEQYLERLEKQFETKEYINLQLFDVGLKQITNNDEFALRIKQDYYSSNYSDTGYLFLIVDMNDAARPLIKLRTWQPHRDPEINAHLKNTQGEKYYGLIYEGNFE